MHRASTRLRSIRVLSAFVLRVPRWVSIALVVAVSVALSVGGVLAALSTSGDVSPRLFAQSLAIAVIVPTLVAGPVSAVIVELVHALRDEHVGALEAAQRDELTGLPNRRRTLELARRELEHARRAGRPYSVALVDLDDFKAANDRHGHATGDALLRATARACRQTLDGHGVAGRWGGEEFLVLLPGADAQSAAELMERLRGSIADCGVALAGGARIACTASIGVATLRGGPVRDAAANDPDADATIERLVAAADRRMYEAKANGKNRVAAGAPTARRASG